MGSLKGVKRIVDRQGMKAELARLKLIIKTHQPLIAAMQITQKAYKEGEATGFEAGLKEGYGQGVNAGKPDYEPAELQPTLEQVAKDNAGRMEELGG